MNDKIPGGGFFVARTLFDSRIWRRPPLYLKVWLWILGRANHSDRKIKGVPYRRGELVTTYDEIIQSGAYYHNRKHIVPTLKQIRLILEWLKDQGMIQVFPIRGGERPTRADPRARTRAYLGIRIVVVNYETYQDLGNYKGRDKGRPSVQQGHDNKNEEECKTNDKPLSPPSGGPSEKKKFPEDSKPFHLASLLFDLIRQNNPGFKLKSSLQEWAKHVDFAIRLDKRSPEELERVIRWVQSDSFWMGNVLSTRKLREKYDALIMKMNSSRKGKPHEDFSNKQYIGTPLDEITWLE